MIEICIVASTVCIMIITAVYIANSYPQKDTNDIVQILDKHYKDMITLTNQFANLSTQLYNQNKNNDNMPASFPSAEEMFPVDLAKQGQGQGQEEESEPMFDLQGGRL
jgi:hypothetical protein